MSDQQPTSSDPIDAEFEPAETETATTEETSTGQKPARKSGPGWLSLLFVMLIAFGAAGLSLWSSGLLEKGLRPDQASTGLASLEDRQQDLSNRFEALEESVGALGARLDDLETRLAETETAVAEPPQTDPAASADLTALEEQVAALETRLSEQADPSIDPQRIADLEAAIQASGNEEGPSSAEVAQLRQQLTSLRREVSQLSSAQSNLGNTVNEARQTADSARSQALSASQMALAIASLETALSRGGLIEESAALLQSLQTSSSAVSTISTLSANSVASEDSLHQRFLELRDTALDRDSEAAGEPGWVNSLFGDYVSVRRGSADSETSAQLEAATSALETGNLEAALRAVEDLPDASRSVYESWIGDARQRIQLVNAVTALRLEFIEQAPR